MPPRNYTRPRISSRTLRPVDGRLARRLAEIGRAYFRSGETRSAVSVLRGAVAADATDAGIRLELARALHAAGRLEAALRWCQAPAVRKLPGASALRAELLLDLGKLEKALAAVEQALEEEPGRNDLRFKAAAVLLAGGRNEDAERLLSRWPGKPPARASLLMARVLLARNRLQQALAALEEVDSKERGPEFYELKAAALFAGGGKAAEHVLREGIARFPTSAELRLHLAELTLEHPAAEKAEAQELENVLQPLFDGSAEKKVEARAWLLLGKSYLRRPGGEIEASRCLERALALAPDDPGACLLQGEICLENGRPGPALPWLLRALLKQPGHRRAQAAFARALCQSADDEAVSRWLALLLAALPQQAADVLAGLLRAVQHAGREEAYQDAYREVHRAKNLVAVAASRSGDAPADIRRLLENLYQEMSRLLERIRQPAQERELLSLAEFLPRLVEQSGCAPVELVLRPNLPPLRADGHALGEALTNLLRNARQASPPGEPVRLEARLSRDGWLEMAVTDRGPGIALEMQERIFEPGFTTRPGGSGMGLSIARRTVLQQGGSLALFSAPGGPTTFLVRLPPAEGAEAGRKAGAVRPREVTL